MKYEHFENQIAFSFYCFTDQLMLEKRYLHIKRGEACLVLREKKLTGIMDLIDEMQKIDTDSIEPMSHALDINQPLRKDEVSESDIRKKTMPLAPEAEDSVFMVPQVIE